MIGNDEFGNLHLRERRKGGERLCICRYEVIYSSKSKGNRLNSYLSKSKKVLDKKTTQVVSY